MGGSIFLAGVRCSALWSAKSTSRRPQKSAPFAARAPKPKSRRWSAWGKACGRPGNQATAGPRARVPSFSAFLARKNSNKISQLLLQRNKASWFALARAISAYSPTALWQRALRADKNERPRWLGASAVTPVFRSTVTALPGALSQRG